MNNDLISREALKDYARKVMYEQNATNFSLLKMFDEIIDNAPTVETDIKVVAKDAYEQGYTDGWKERFGEPNERPQGEWKLMQGSSVVFDCSCCNARIIAMIPYNFCPNCGANMKGGADMRKPNCVTCDHFGKCEGCEKGDEE